MKDIYLYFAAIYVIMTLALIYNYFASGNVSSLLFAVLVGNFAVTHFYMGIFMNGILLQFPMSYGIFPFLSIVNLSWGIIWFLYKMKEKRISRYVMEFIPSFVLLVASVPAFLLPRADKIALSIRALQDINPLLMPTKIPVSILFFYMLHMIFTIQGRIAKSIHIGRAFQDFRRSGYKFNSIIAIYAGMVITLVFIAMHMLIIASGIFPTAVIYMYLPGAWIFLMVFLQIFDNYAPMKEFNKRYAKDSVSYSKSQLRSIDLNTLENRLENLMQVRKLYRNENLTLQKLARQLEVSPQQLSEFLNVSKKSGYREYVNSYRIEEAKKILIEKPELNASLVGFEVGFPSVSGFYKIFKKQTRVSPADFRKL